MLSLLLWVIGPLAVHFHLFFPQDTKVLGKQYWLWGLYIVAVLGCLPYLVFGA